MDPAGDTGRRADATAWMLHEMGNRGTVPAVLLFNRVNPILAQGASFGNVALMDRFEIDITRLIAAADGLLVQPALG